LEHRKVYHSIEQTWTDQTLIIEGPVPAEALRGYRMHPGLDAFRRPQEQYEALIEIAELDEGRIIAARDGETIVGYVTFHYPDEMERWSEGNMEDLVELGAIEVAPSYRSKGLGKKMIRLAFLDGQLDNMIVFTTEYYWHWDLEGSKLNVWDYRKMMEQLMEAVGMVWYATDDPEICSHPANCLMVKIGREVPHSSVEQFDRVRFHRKFMY
jgi:acetoin utilization protein AcuA